MKKYALYILLLFFTNICISQQLPQISLRHKNLFFLNPAVAGSTSSQEIKILHREQWAGFENAPTTSVISFNKEINTTNGIGGYIINDITNPTSRLTLNLSYAYIIDMDDIFLSFGLSGKIIQYRINGADLTYRDINDPVMAFGTEKKWRPEANCGVLLYSRNFYTGFSINNLIKSQFRPFANDELGEIYMVRHIYFMGQYDFIFETHRISPGIYIGYAKKSPINTELNISWLYNNSLHSSLGYRFGDAINLALGYRFGRFSLYYGYDIVTSALRNVNSGSHEVMLGIDISREQKNIPMFSSGGSSNRHKYNRSKKRMF